MNRDPTHFPRIYEAIKQLFLANSDGSATFAAAAALGQISQNSSAKHQISRESARYGASSSPPVWSPHSRGARVFRAQVAECPAPFLTQPRVAITGRRVAGPAAGRVEGGACLLYAAAAASEMRSESEEEMGSAAAAAARRRRCVHVHRTTAALLLPPSPHIQTCSAP